MERIVVGVDGSDVSRAALGWAVAEARLRGAAVDAVHAWSYPVSAYSGTFMMTSVISRDDLVSAAQATLDEVCDAVDTRDVVLSRIVEEGPAARCLLETAQGADLLVVGSRGRGGFSGLLLGSVSQQCAHHAPCPIVIIR